ncbi:hypothetical protein Xoosp13_333 [Xanthomonas phage Xoo-sp13]|nr:hypothetical protein Xoosp13_333 [Xanthomonas phage Xoo-sp13]
MNDRMFNDLNSILASTSGDIIDFRVYKGVTFSYLVKLGNDYNREVIGMDTFYGLEVPQQEDYNEHNQLSYPRGYAPSTPILVHQAIKKVCPDATNYKIYEGNLQSVLRTLEDRKYAIAIIDLYQYNPTKIALDYIYSKMADGGVLYCLNYNKSSSCLASRAINEFIGKNSEDIIIRPPVVFNDNILNVCIIECGESSANISPSPIKSPPKKSKLSSLFKKDPINIALVLRTGGDTYDYRYVNAMARNIRNKTKLKIKISVLTDNPTGIDPELVDVIIPLIHKYKGWWSKIELFRPGIFTGDRVVFFDLDTVIVSNIDDILKHDTMFAGISDLYHQNVLQTGVMSWNPNYNHHIYQNFIPLYRSALVSMPEGDAKWIRDNLYNYEYLQTKFPGKIVSFKAHCLDHNTDRINIPSSASIVCFHGKPRPHTIMDQVITQHWVYQ